MMRELIASMRGLIDRDEGATALEYALLITLVAIAIVIGAVAVGTAMEGMYSGYALTVDTLL